MKKNSFVFISDFDGTLSTKDFYQIVIDDYLGESGMELYKSWRRGELLDKEFLGKIYSSMDRNEEEIMEDILKITLDEGAIQFINRVKASGGDFIILSAGTSYYIEKLLKNNNIEGIKVYSNPGVYKNKGIQLRIDENSKYYSERYGIDKAKVVADYKEKYEKVFFAGDSQPDIAPAKIADIAFAKSGLIEMLDSEKMSFVPVQTFREVEDYLEREGVLI